MKIVRTNAGESQQVFADHIGVSRNYVSLLELGDRDPSGVAIHSICREYNVSRKWLETGEGEMHEPLPEGDAELLESMAGVLTDASSSKKKIIGMAMQLPEELAEMLIKFLESQISKGKGHP